MTVTFNANAAFCKCFSLWNGSGNNAPPLNWFTTGFDDSAWPHAVPALPRLGSDLWSHTTTGFEENEYVLFRQPLVVPPGIITSASLMFYCDDGCVGIYINSHFISGSVRPTIGWYTVTVPLAYLVGGAVNVIASECFNVFFNFAGWNFVLTLELGRRRAWSYIGQ